MMPSTASAWTLPDGFAIVAGRLTTTSRFEAGAHLLHLPRQSVLTKDDAQSTSLLRYLDEEQVRGLPHWAALPDEFVLALQLALSEHLASASAASPLNGTAHWTATQRENLVGSYVLRRALEHGERVEGQLRTLLSALASHDPAFFAAPAFSAVRMRSLLHAVTAHSVVPLPLGRPVLLLPLPPLRMANRGAASVRFDVSSGNVTLRSLRRLAPGEELTFDAGRHDHATMMMRQGDPGIPLRRCATLGLSAESTGSGSGDGPSHAAMPLTLSMPADDPMGAAKELLLSKASLSARDETFMLHAGSPPPPKLLSYARVLVLQEHELHLLTDGELPASPLSRSNEEYAFRLIASRIDALLAEYPTTPEEDEYSLSALLGSSSRSRALASKDGERRGAAVCASLLEKRLLASTIGALSAGVQDYLRSDEHLPSSEDDQILEPPAGSEPPGAGPASRSRSPRRRRRRRQRGQSASKSEL